MSDQAAVNMRVLQAGLCLAKTHLLAPGSVTLKKVTRGFSLELLCLHFTISKHALNIDPAPFFIPTGSHRQLSDMLLRDLPQREDPQHRHLSPHRLWEDHPDRARPLLHRQDSRDPRGECRPVFVYSSRFVSSSHEVFSSFF